MAVNIEVDLDLGSQEIAEVETKLAAIGDNVDFGNIDINDIIDGDLDDVLNFDDLDGALSDLGDITVDTESTQNRVVPSLLARMHSELQDIHRAIKTTGGASSGGGGVPGPAWRDLVDFADEDESSSSVTKSLFPEGIEDIGRPDIPDSFGGDQIPPRQLIDSQRRVDPFKFIDRTRSEFEIPSAADLDVGDSISRLDRDTLGVDQDTKLNVDTRGGIVDKVDLDSAGIPRFNSDLDIPDPSDTRNFRKVISRIQQGDEVFASLTKTINRLRPRIGQIYNAFAALIPILIGLVGVAGAAAISLSSLLAIGGAIGILGALGGEADTLSGSIKDLKDRLKEFKKALFQAVQPAADVFAPIVDKGLDLVVTQVKSLRDELKGFRQFGGLFLQAIAGSGELVEQLFQKFNKLSPMIQQMARRVGSLIAAALPRFFESATKEAFEHQNALKNVLSMFWSLGRVIYNFSVILLEVLSAFSFLTGIFNFLANVLNNRLVRGFIILFSALLSVVGIMGVFAKIQSIVLAQMAAQTSLLGILNGLWITTFAKSAIGAISTVLTAIMTMNASLLTTATLVQAITGGLAAVGAIIGGGALISAAGDAITPNTPASMPGGGGPGAISAGDQNIEINQYGEMNNQDRQWLKDNVNELTNAKQNRRGHWTTFN